MHQVPPPPYSPLPTPSFWQSLRAPVCCKTMATSNQCCLWNLHQTGREAASLTLHASSHFSDQMDGASSVCLELQMHASFFTAIVMEWHPLRGAGHVRTYHRAFNPQPTCSSILSNDTVGSHLKAVSRNPSSALVKLGSFMRELMISQASKGRENLGGREHDVSIRITACGIPLV